MRKWLLTALAVGACTTSFASIQLNSEMERIGASILSERLGIPIDEILGVGDRYDRSVYDLAPMFSIEHETHRSTDEIWRLRQQGMGWGNIAKRLGMHPGTFNKMRVRGEFDNDWMWDDVMRNRYGWSDSQIRTRRSKGQRWGTIFLDAERARKGGRSTVKTTTKSGMTHGKSGGTHGKSGVTHGKSGVTHGNSGTTHGKSGSTHGKSGGSHGKSGGDHGKGGHGKSGGGHGKGG